MVLDHASDRQAAHPRVVSPGPAAYRYEQPDLENMQWLV